MRLAAAALSLAAALILCGCMPPPSETAEPPPDKKSQRNIPNTARIVCDGDGTRVLTPEVAARRDGVHLVVDNRLRGDYGFSVRTPEGGGGGYNAPSGESRHVLEAAPGEVRVGCYQSYKDTEPDYGTLEIRAGDSGYKPVGLECEGGMAVEGGPMYAPGAKGKRGEPVELTRGLLSENIREGDAVELAGYPGSHGRRTVRVVRDGRVVATVEYFGAGGGWLQDNHAACAGF